MDKQITRHLSTHGISLSDLVKCLKFPRGPRGAKNAPSLITHIRKFVLKSIAFKCQRLLLVNPFGETTHSEEVQQLEDNINGVLAVEDVTNFMNNPLAARPFIGARRKKIAREKIWEKSVCSSHQGSLSFISLPLFLALRPN